jgi:hypothetical protein
MMTTKWCSGWSICAIPSAPTTTSNPRSSSGWPPPSPTKNTNSPLASATKSPAALAPPEPSPRPRFAGLLLAVALAALWDQPLRAQDAPLRPAHRRPLFNGRDLAGWTTWLVDSQHQDPRRVFSVDQGLLRISGDGFGYLATVDAFRDYHLRLEFRWGNRNWRGRQRAARDSGLFLHSAGPHGNSLDGQGAYKAAIECQIMEGSVGDLLLIKGRDHRQRPIPVGFTAEVAPQRDAEGWAWWQPGGQRVRFAQTGRLNWFAKDPCWTDTYGFRGPRDLERPAGQWNTLDCRCHGDQLDVTLNGRRVNQARQLAPSSGPILLQCEGSEIFFRAVELYPLDDPPD